MVAQANGYNNEVTEDALMDASMSMLDVTGSNAALIFQVVGLEIENLNLSAGSYDTAAEEIIELAREQKERNDNDGKDAAIAVMEDIQAAELERLSVSYSDGQFHMFGMDIDEEDMDAAVQDTLDNFDDVVAKNNLNTEQAANLQALLLAYQDPNATGEQKAQILEQIGQDYPNVATKMANDAGTASERRNQAQLDDTEVAQRDVNGIEDNGAFVAATDRSGAVEQADTVDMALELRSGNSVSMAGSMDMANSFEAGFSPPSDEFNTAARGDVSLAETDPALDAKNVAPTLSGPSLSA